VALTCRRAKHVLEFPVLDFRIRQHRYLDKRSEFCLNHMFERVLGPAWTRRSVNYPTHTFGVNSSFYDLQFQCY
jgi:hypothetical protein